MDNDAKKLAEAVIANMTPNQVQSFLEMTDEQQMSYAAQLGIDQCKKFIDMGVQVLTKQDIKRDFAFLIEKVYSE